MKNKTTFTIIFFFLLLKQYHIDQIRILFTSRRSSFNNTILQTKNQIKIARFTFFFESNMQYNQTLFHEDLVFTKKNVFVYNRNHFIHLVQNYPIKFPSLQ